MSNENLVTVQSLNNTSHIVDSNRLEAEPIQQTENMEEDFEPSKRDPNSATFIIQPDWNEVLR